MVQIHLRPRAADRRRAAVNRKGDLIRTAWRPRDKTRAVCLDCDWTATDGIAYPNAARDARDHARDNVGHRTRLASVEIVQYEATGEQGITKSHWGRPRGR